jgi:hypothetical protein
MDELIRVSLVDGNPNASYFGGLQKINLLEIAYLRHAIYLCNVSIVGIHVKLSFITEWNLNAYYLSNLLQ